MFAGLEEPVHAHAARRWTATLSFTLQAALLAAALVIPLLTPQNLPDALVRRRIFVPMSQGEPSVSTTQTSGHRGAISSTTPFFVNRGGSLHFGHSSLQSGSEAGQPGISVIGVESDPRGVLDSMGAQVPVLSHPVAIPHSFRVSVMMQGNLINRVEPLYPAIAKQAGIQGSVVIKAIISRDGRIERTEVLRGHPLLNQAALEAVHQWKYRPYYLNGEPVEVETQITVNFVLNR